MATRVPPDPTLRVAAAAVLAAALLPAASGAWTPKTQLLIAERAAAIAPTDLRRQIDKHIAEFRRGNAASFRNGDAHSHYKNGNGGGSLDARILAETERAVAAIRGHRPFRDVVYQLGLLSHYIADANNPLNTAEKDPLEERYSPDYLGYVEGAQDRFALVFYGEGRDLAEPAALAPLVDRTLDRGRRLYPSIAREYRRVGGPPGQAKFDDKSVAFAVGSLALSHAVSDVGAVFRYVWIEAGGADRRRLPLTAPGGESEGH